jgi:hypothetical protein
MRSNYVVPAGGGNWLSTQRQISRALTYYPPYGLDYEKQALWLILFTAFEKVYFFVMRDGWGMGFHELIMTVVIMVIVLAYGVVVLGA